MSSERAGTLYLVSTPIGNLGDMTHRAVEVLSSTALIIAEDTRHSRRLLDHYKISTPLKSYHEHNEAQETPKLVARLRAGDSVALISDAGTPLISDPGSRLVAAALEAKLPVVPIPGASSVMAAIVGSGMPLERFTFTGFLPRKGRERTEMIADVVASHSTIVMFEAANRVGATLGALADAGAGDRPAVVARELTKQFEEFKRGSVAELAGAYKDVNPKGEVVLVIAGAEKATVSESELSDAARKLRASGNSPRDIMEHLMSGLGAPRNLAYKLAHESES
ncbi:MAG: 16S rRNA (cytidine(1402)-2'-O)-methyltransferase [Gemmatimonadota bacterium]|nr:16S rRNA (cytidine(1402)-2'-O)-methyltransferase [Gemmatimonadota bacterium]